MYLSNVLILNVITFGGLAARGLIAAGAGYGRNEPRKQYLTPAVVAVGHMILAVANLAWAMKSWPN